MVAGRVLGALVDVGAAGRRAAPAGAAPARVSYRQLRAVVLAAAVADQALVYI